MNVGEAFNLGTIRGAWAICINVVHEYLRLKILRRSCELLVRTASTRQGRVPRSYSTMVHSFVAQKYMNTILSVENVPR